MLMYGLNALLTAQHFTIKRELHCGLCVYDSVLYTVSTLVIELFPQPDCNIFYLHFDTLWGSFLQCLTVKLFSGGIILGLIPPESLRHFK